MAVRRIPSLSTSAAAFDRLTLYLPKRRFNNWQIENRFVKYLSPSCVNSNMKRKFKNSKMILSKPKFAKRLTKIE